MLPFPPNNIIAQLVKIIQYIREGVFMLYNAAFVLVVLAVMTGLLVAIKSRNNN